MTIRTFTLPDLGEGLTEADIIRWLVAAGDTVVVDQAIVEVETAKSVVEVPCPFAGTVQTLHAEADTVLAVGAPLISVEDGIGDGGDPDGAPGGQSAGAGVGSADEGAGDGDVSGHVLVGYGTSGGTASRRTRRPRRGAAAPVTAPAAAPVAESVVAEVRQAPRVVNPLVRRLAREHGIALADVRGTGPGELIMRADVTSAIEAASATESASPASPAGDEGGTGGSAVVAAAPCGDLDSRTGLRVTGIEKVSGIRKATAAAVSRSRREIPEATIWVDVDVTPLLELRAGLRAAGDEKVPGLLAFAARFVLAGLERYPQLAQRFEDDGEGGQRIVSFDGVNLGFAAQTERGLVVPAVRQAHTMTARQLHGELRRLTELARSGEASPQELSGGTFTLNNYGVFGVDGSSAIINHPEAAILGMGRIIDRPWGVDGELRLRKIMQLSLVFDHRICDGGTAGGFIRFVADCFENPAGVLADL